MEVANTRELLGRLDAGKLDFAVVEGFFDKTSYDHLRYASEPFVAVCAPGYPLPPEAKRLADLLGERLITREPGSGTRTILEKHLELQNLTLGDFWQVMEISSLEAVKALAMEGCGVTFLYQAAVRDELADGRLQEIELEDFRYRHDFTFLWRKNSVFPAWYHRLFHELGGVEAEQ